MLHFTHVHEVRVNMRTFENVLWNLLFVWLLLVPVVRGNEFYAS